MNRSQEIIRTSWIGIAANVLLAGFKAAVGILASSVAIVMDAVNNLSDALSSVITIVGTKLSQRPADRKHPFGFGRIEYFSAIIIAVIVLSAGITSLIESVKKIFDPTEPEYTMVTLVVIVVAIVVKLILGQYVKRKGEQLKSDALIASGSDALFDAVITLATLISAGVMLLWGCIARWYSGCIDFYRHHQGRYRDACFACQRTAGYEHLGRFCKTDSEGSLRLRGRSWCL